MIYSMTAFARCQSEGEWGHLVCEMRSINHRFLEIGIHSSEAIRMLEMSIREFIQRFVKRGKIECLLRYHLRTSLPSHFHTINDLLAEELCSASKKIAFMLKDAAGPINPTDILRFPGVLETKETDLSVLQLEVMKLVEQTLQELMKAREREGEELHHLITKRLILILGQLRHIKDRLPIVIADQQQRLQKRFADAQLDVDTARLEQEMLMFSQKIDIAEEVERTETHVKEIQRILQQGGVVGRRLDFLLQELNREANTIGSKSNDSIISHIAVELKVLIEQIREQIQNIE